MLCKIAKLDFSYVYFLHFTESSGNNDIFYSLKIEVLVFRNPKTYFRMVDSFLITKLLVYIPRNGLVMSRKFLDKLLASFNSVVTRISIYPRSATYYAVSRPDR